MTATKSWVADWRLRHPYYAMALASIGRPALPDPLPPEWEASDVVAWREEVDRIVEIQNEGLRLMTVEIEGDR